MESGPRAGTAAPGGRRGASRPWGPKGGFLAGPDAPLAPKGSSVPPRTTHIVRVLYVCVCARAHRRVWQVWRVGLGSLNTSFGPFAQPKVKACELAQEIFAIGMAYPLKSMVFDGFEQTWLRSFVTLSKRLNLTELPSHLQSRVP